MDRIVSRLVALNEYSREQALFVAKDIIRWRFSSHSRFNKEILP